MDLEIHVEQLMAEMSMPEAGRRLVRSALAGEPVRSPQGRRGNVVTRFFSKKMGRMLKLESRRGETAQAVLLEDDDDVLAYFPQPLTADVLIQDKEGTTRGRTSYTPDFLVVRRKAIVLIETRDELQLLKDELRSDQFFRDQDETWHYRAAENHFQALGIKHHLFSNSRLPSVLVQNTRFLEDYGREDCPPLDDQIKGRLLGILGEHRSIPYLKLIHEFDFAADAVFKAILDRDIYADIYHDRLDVGSDLVIFSDKATGDAYQLARRAELEPVLPIPGTTHIAPGTTIKFDGKEFEVVLSGERDVMIRDEDGHVRAVPLASLIAINNISTLGSDSAKKLTSGERKLADYSPDEIQRALRRLNALNQAESKGMSDRSHARYSAAIALAENDFEAMLALVDNVRNRGNREKRLPPIVEELAQEAIQGRYNTSKKGKKKAAYAVHMTKCKEYEEEHHVTTVPMSYVTFCRRCDEYEDVRKREGKRSAYQKRAIPELLDHAYPVHGVRPHEVCYIDHTIATIATVSPDGVELGKPTFSLAVDGNTTHPRAFVVTYDPPSANIVLLVLRDYVRRHGRLPRIICVDNGKEFHSLELERFCKLYGIDLRYRPPGMPRGGAMIERALGCTEDEVLAELQGNTRQMRDPRLVTKSINPFGVAVWTLTAVWGAFDEYLFKVRPDRIHPALGMTPNQFEAKRIAETGQREHTLIRFDQNIMLMTSPHAKRPVHTIDKRRGIWVDGMYHWHPRMAKSKCVLSHG